MRFSKRKKIRPRKVLVIYLNTFFLLKYIYLRRKKKNKKKMPQLDPIIYFNQLFWFFSSFLCVYLYSTYCIVPKINFYNLIKYNIQFKFSAINNSFDINKTEEFISVQSSLEFALFRNYIFSILNSNSKYENGNIPISTTSYSKANFADVYTNILVSNFSSKKFSLLMCFFNYYYYAIRRIIAFNIFYLLLILKIV